jgi:hypothetical protein
MPKNVSSAKQTVNLNQLNAAMIGLEEERLRLITGHEELTAVTDRETAQNALNVVVTFLLDRGIESSPVARLLSALSALSAGSSLPNIFKPLPASNRRPDSPAVEAIKGRLAAVAEYWQQSGKDRKTANQWVVELISQIKAPLGKSTTAAVDSWRVKWDGDRGTTDSAGRDGYLAMRSILTDKKPSEDQLKRMIKASLFNHPS